MRLLSSSICACVGRQTGLFSVGSITGLEEILLTLIMSLAPKARNSTVEQCSWIFSGESK
jgi:hypothetical protein